MGAACSGPHPYVKGRPELKTIKKLSAGLFVVLLTAVVLEPGNASQGVPAAQGQIVKHGIVVDFEAHAPGNGELMEGQLAEMRFRLTEGATGAPVSGITPGVWMDMGHIIQGKPGSHRDNNFFRITMRFLPYINNGKGQQFFFVLVQFFL